MQDTKLLLERIRIENKVFTALLLIIIIFIGIMSIISQMMEQMYLSIGVILSFVLLLILMFPLLNLSQKKLDELNEKIEAE